MVGATGFEPVKFEVANLKPFACLVFPVPLACKNALQQPHVRDELR